MISYSGLLAIFVLALSGAQSFFNHDNPTGLYLNWTSSHPNGSATGRSGRVKFDTGRGGPNALDENGSGGITRRLVIATERGSCTDLCQEPDISNQACVTSSDDETSDPSDEDTDIAIHTNNLLDGAMTRLDARENDIDDEGERALQQAGGSR
jgi:hypothetical protein